MRKFITKFLLIFSVNLLANTENLNPQEQSKENSIINSIIKNDENINEENISKEKEEIVDIISKTTKINEDDEEAKNIINIIADKAVRDETNLINQDNNLGFIVFEIKDLNQKISILKSNLDANSSKNEIENINKEKNVLLNKIPSVITNQTIKKEELFKYIKQKNKVKNNLKKYSNNKQSFNYINNLLQFEQMNLWDEFFSTFLKLEQIFLNGANKNELKTTIQKNLLNIQLLNFQEIKQNIENLKIKDSDLEILKKSLSDLENTKFTYEEILKFLLDNTNLLATNFIFTSLNLGSLISYINDISPFKSSAINLGKILPIIMIMIALFSIRKFLANIIYMFFTLFSKNKSNEGETKTQVINIIKKPMGILLIGYGVDICLSIFYYPNPVPLIFANFFDVVYIILYAWLFTEIINGYGVILISKLATKGSRKEVLNLIVKFLYIVVIIIAILMILSSIGLNVSAIIASLGIGGLAIALATKDIIANLFASIMVLFDNSFSQGDSVVIGSVEGVVVETGLRKTTIRTSDNALVFVPNSKIIDNNIKNWSRRKVGRHMKMYLGLKYSTTPKQIVEFIKDVKTMLLEHPGIAKPNENSSKSRHLYKQKIVSIDDFAGYKSNLYVVLDEFADSSINIMVYCYSKSIAYADFLEVKQDVMLKIAQILDKHGLEFAFPSQSLYVEQMPK
ncbi:mechanosensitive ion channel [Campylobacter sp. FMV-PI01]|uniref:Mechanosensitive ion channel n=1 Tax=Campylobacter portucalensis TaxID=2608384 RepID=A0A6L5WGT0_9BACT|nr:mechanosensitive ion channel domain-containing protein [Campylobacter portucalensis]MSN96229.1 mechanosensitive ion channel [Campylobacter portucalensis]